MKNTMYRKGLMIMMVLFGLASFFGCAKEKPNESGLESFSYHYNGTSMDSIYSYTLTRTGSGKAEFAYETMRFSDMGEIIIETEESALDQLYELYLKHEAYKWDGYDQNNVNVLDGNSYSVALYFKDGRSMSIRGTNSRPKGYSSFENEFTELINPLIQQAVDKANSEMIDRGVSGALTSAMINFMRHGGFGGDQYEILLYTHREGRKNFDVRIRSVSGEFIEPGKYNYYYEMADEDIGFENIRAILERHDVLKWYGWDKAAEDYNNSEWFQVSFSYEEGSIGAMGTAHPEGYEEVRRELLEYIVKIIKAAEAKYDDFRSRDI